MDTELIQFIKTKRPELEISPTETDGSVLDPEVAKRCLYEMLRIRMVEEKIVELYPEQEMRCPTHLSIGQEAARSILTFDITARYKKFA